MREHFSSKLQHKYVTVVTNRSTKVKFYPTFTHPFHEVSQARSLQPLDIDNDPTDEIGILSTLILCCLTTGDWDEEVEEEAKPAIEGDDLRNGGKLKWHRCKL